MGFNLNALKQAISSLKNNISNSYDACQSKGATMPTNKNSSNLPDCILSIPSGGSSVNAQPCSYFNVTLAPITDPEKIPEQFTIDFSQIGVNFKSIVIYSATNDGYFSITKIDSTKCVISAHPFVKYDSEYVYGITDLGAGTYRANYSVSGNSITFTRANYEHNDSGYANDNFRTLPSQIAPIDSETGQVDYMLELINVLV